MEEREGDQKRMYDRLFQALDEQQANGGSQNGTPHLLRRAGPGNIGGISSGELNSTSGSWFGANAVEDMQK